MPERKVLISCMPFSAPAGKKLVACANRCSFSPRYRSAACWLRSVPAVALYTKHSATHASVSSAHTASNMSFPRLGLLNRGGAGSLSPIRRPALVPLSFIRPRQSGRRTSIPSSTGFVEVVSTMS